MLSPAFVLLDLAIVLALGVLGMLGAWLLRRHSTLSVKNLYVVAVLVGSALAVSVAARAWSAVLVLAPLGAPALARRGIGASLAPGGSRRRRGAAPARALTAMGVAAGAGQTSRGSGDTSHLRARSFTGGRGLMTSSMCR